VKRPKWFRKGISKGKKKSEPEIGGPRGKPSDMEAQANLLSRETRPAECAPPSLLKKKNAALQGAERLAKSVESKSHPPTGGGQ